MLGAIAGSTSEVSLGEIKSQEEGEKRSYAMSEGLWEVMVRPLSPSPPLSPSLS